MIFVVTSYLMTCKKSRQGRQKIARGAARGIAERNPGNLRNDAQQRAMHPV